MKKQIEKQIKELYGTKLAFCKSEGYRYKDFASKMRTVETKVNWLNRLLKPLKLKIKIKSL